MDRLRPRHPAFDAEMELLIAVARARPDAQGVNRMRTLLGRVHDWPALLVRASRHKMLPLLTMHLQHVHDQVPSEMCRLLAVYSLESDRLMLRIIREMKDLFTMLEMEGIVAVPYKGPVLGAQLYGSALARQAGDIDILVSRADAVRARALLLGRGYFPRHPLGRGGERFMFRSRYSETFDHASGTTVELHWAFTNGDIALRLTLEEMLPNLERVSVRGASFPVFGREDLLLTLCVHGSKHRWERLEWLCGLGEAIRSGGQVDWDGLLQRATAMGVCREVLLGVLLAHDLLGVVVPERVLDAARADAPVTYLAAQVPRLLAQKSNDAEADSLATDLFRFRLRKRRRDRLRFVLYRILTPSQPERWRAVSVGSVVLPLHGFVRPFRLLRHAASFVYGRLTSPRGIRSPTR